MKRFTLTVLAIVIPAVLIFGIVFRVFLERSGGESQTVQVTTNENAVNAIQEVQGYTLQSGKFTGKTIDTVMYESFSTTTAFNTIGWKAVKADNGGYIVGYDVKDIESKKNISYMFYFIDAKVYTLNGLAIGMCGKDIKYDGEDALDLIHLYAEEI